MVLGVLTIYYRHILAHLTHTSSYTHETDKFMVWHEFLCKNGWNITTEIKTRARHHIYGARGVLTIYYRHIDSYKLLHTWNWQVHGLTIFGAKMVVI